MDVRCNTCGKMYPTNDVEGINIRICPRCQRQYQGYSEGALEKVRQDRELARDIEATGGPANMTWEKLFFKFDGRIGRQSYWLGWLALGAPTFLVMSIIFSLDVSDMDRQSLVGIMGLAYLWIFAALQTKRWHDRNKTGLLVVISFIPVIWLWALVECGFLRGDSEQNNYGMPEKWHKERW